MEGCNQGTREVWPGREECRLGRELRKDVSEERKIVLLGDLSSLKSLRVLAGLILVPEMVQWGLGDY